MHCCRIDSAPNARHAAQPLQGRLDIAYAMGGSGR